MFKYTKEKSLVFEKQLNKLHELPLGAFIGQSLQLIYKSESRGKRIMEGIKSFLYYIAGEKKSFNPNQFSHLNTSAKYHVLTLIKNDHRYKEFILPVCEKLLSYNENLILLAPADFLTSNNFIESDKFHLITWDAFKGEPAETFYKKPSITKILSVCLKNGFPIFTAFRFLYLIKSQINKANNYRVFLKSILIKTVLTEYDRNSKVAPLIGVANLNSHPTFSLVHGSLLPPDTYYPFVAKKILVWGSRQTDTFTSLGYNKEKFIKVGNNRIKSIVINKNEKLFLLEKIQISGQDKIATLITNRIEPQEQKRFAAVFIEAIYNMDHWRGVIKLHPLENKAEYENFFPGLYKDKIKIVQSSELRNEDVIKITDVFINHNSVMGLEMLIQDKPVVILDCIKKDPGIGREMHETGNCLLAHNADELVNVIIASFNNQAINRHSIELYKKQYFFAIGEEAVINITNELLNENS